MNIFEFFDACNAHPWAYIALFMNLAVVFINGWTDGPNAVATAVMTRAIRPKIAVFMCAILNLVGALLVGLLAYFGVSNAEVSETIASILNISNFSIDMLLIIISSSMLAIVITSLVCTFFGFPSSESNALVGGITGSGIMATLLSGNMNIFSNINLTPWIKIIIGFFGSLILGFILGFLLTYLIILICKKMHRGKTTKFFSKAQIASSALMSFTHGLQDGAKFIGVSILIAVCLNSNYDTSSYAGVYYIFLPVAITMFLGTMMGGYKIMKTMGSGMARLQKFQAFATDIASGISLILASCFGLPISTSNVKSTSIIGTGAAKNFKKVKRGTSLKMIGSWILLFPASAIIGAITILCLFWFG